MRLPRSYAGSVAVAAFLSFFGCSEDSKPTIPAVPDDAVPGFALTDVNPTSSTYNKDVSPRRYLGKVSAWYFGHAT